MVQVSALASLAAHYSYEHADNHTLTGILLTMICAILSVHGPCPTCHTPKRPRCYLCNQAPYLPNPRPLHPTSNNLNHAWRSSLHRFRDMHPRILDAELWSAPENGVAGLA